MLESLEGLIIGLASVNGLNTESMARGHGFRFMEIGRRLERALYTLGLLRTGCELPPETEKVVWEMVLAMTDSLMTYRRRYASAVQAGAVLDLLLLDESNPRSVGYQLVQIREQVPGLPRKKPRPHPERRRAYRSEGAHHLAGNGPWNATRHPPGTKTCMRRWVNCLPV